METRDIPSITIHSLADAHHFVCRGIWTLHDLKEITMQLEAFLPAQNIVWDLNDLSSIDSAGIALIQLYKKKYEDEGFVSTFIGLNDEVQRLFQLLYPHASASETKENNDSLLYRLGKNSYEAWLSFVAFLTFLGEAFIILLHSLRSPSSIRYKSISSHILSTGLNALPIIAISAFLIGVVVAYQSLVQLQKFGADIFIVETISISLTRELAPLITAIIVAGRSGSAFTAQIGAMKMTQEIDAMNTMGFHPHLFLVWPRIFALMIVMPLLIFFADIIGIFGGMVIANTQSNLSSTEFITRLQSVLPLKHLIIGISKGPFFAFLIATVSCFRGFQVSSNTESIGQFTTQSVVNAIFLVIACDALFSILLTELKL